MSINQALQPVVTTTSTDVRVTPAVSLSYSEAQQPKVAIGTSQTVIPEPA